MKKIRVLQVSFDTFLPPYQIPAFRAAVAQKAGLDLDTIHNHHPNSGKSLFRYPIVQFKLESLRQNRMRPMLFCMEQGVEDAYHFFAQPDWTVNVLGDWIPLRIAKLDVRQHTLQVWEHPFRYRLHKWQALNQDNYATWQSLSEADRVPFLENCLRRHIQVFAKSMDWDIGEGLNIRLHNVFKYEWIEFKRFRTLAFSVNFDANVSLPDFVGLGKNVDEGFGVVRKIFKKRVFKTENQTIEI